MATMMEEAVAVTGEIVPAMPTLAEAEAVIERGMKTFVEMGQALKVIQDGELYKEAGYTDFRVYCEQRWGYRKTHVYQLIAAAEVVQAVSAIADTAILTNESHVRALVPLKDNPQAIARVIHAASAVAHDEGRKVTAQMLENEVWVYQARAGEKRTRRNTRLARGAKIPADRPTAMSHTDRLAESILTYVEIYFDKYCSSTGEFGSITIDEVLSAFELARAMFVDYQAQGDYQMQEGSGDE